MPRPALTSGIHHLKLAATDLVHARSFYTEVLGATHLTQYDHRKSDGTLFAIILHLPFSAGGLTIELRLQGPERPHTEALKRQPWNSITLAVGSRAELEDWAAWMQECGTENSGVLRALKGWVLVCDDGEGNRLRMYAEEGEMVPLDQTDAMNEWLAD
ncbi:glyoxalase/bleomycin resistance protein/dioxygenase [Mycena filopes]|nr:glyoxalase/bleomycin resistance protein/dioxygenase [Mycena filopes]